ncbi:MAG: hypothetical protein ACLR8Y_18845 [Alistipes indistinctus]
MAGDFVRDKDAVSACSLAAEAAAWARTQGMTLYDLLRIYMSNTASTRKRWFYIVRKGKEGADEIKKMMDDYRANPPETIGGSPVITIKDYLSSESLDVRDGKRSTISMEIQCTAIFHQKQHDRLHPAFRNRAEDQILFRHL